MKCLQKSMEAVFRLEIKLEIQLLNRYSNKLL